MLRVAFRLLRAETSANVRERSRPVHSGFALKPKPGSRAIACSDIGIVPPFSSSQMLSDRYRSCAKPSTRTNAGGRSFSFLPLWNARTPQARGARAVHYSLDRED